MWGLLLSSDPKLQKLSSTTVGRSLRVFLLWVPGVKKLANMCWGRGLPSSGKLAWESRDMEFFSRIGLDLLHIAR